MDWNAIGLADYGKPADYVRRQVERWSRQYESSKTHDMPDMDRLIAWLKANLPPQGDTSIAHGDYRLENLMFHPSEDRVVAVLDWELATLGDPFAVVGLDPDGRFGLDLGIAGVPETFVVGPDGAIRAVHRGPLTPEIIEREILPALPARDS